MEAIKVSDFSFNIDKKEILRHISLEIQKGSFVGLLGANGCGKSTLLKNIYRHYRQKEEAIYINGHSLKELSKKEFAKFLAIVPQEKDMYTEFTVMEMMRLSRYVHQNFLGYGESDKVCITALEETGILDLKDRIFHYLSGGEKQRVLLAMAFAKGSDIIILDEPTNHLDISYQINIMKNLKERQGKTVFASLHDLNLAAKYCTHIFLMKAGEIIDKGSPEEVLTPENIREAFAIDAYRITDRSGRLHIIAE